jgi:hypothetical protein
MSDGEDQGDLLEHEPNVDTSPAERAETRSVHRDRLQQRAGVALVQGAAALRLHDHDKRWLPRCRRQGQGAALAADRAGQPWRRRHTQAADAGFHTLERRAVPTRKTEFPVWKAAPPRCGKPNHTAALDVEAYERSTIERRCEIKEMLKARRMMPGLRGERLAGNRPGGGDRGLP